MGIIGAGAMGRGLCYQANRTSGIACVGIADTKLERAITCAQETGRPYRTVDTPEDAARAVEEQRIFVCTDGVLLANTPGVDVVIEASSAIGAGGRYAERALLQGKHLVLMNAEVDLTFGPYLGALAEDKGVVYTSADGDQHGVIKRLWDEVMLWDIEPVLAGNMKGFLDRTANPATIVPEADKRDLDYRMATAFTDGTKLAVEMALVANALGFRTDVPGMHGPKAAHVKEAFALFDLEAARASGGIVDYLLGAEPGGGVFLVGHCDDRYQQRMLAYYKMGNGPYYLFYRPYHLCHIEAMRTVAEVYLDGTALLTPDHGFKTNVMTYAKRDLRRGERLDGVGGHTTYGLLENVQDSDSDSGLPICLCDGATLRREMARDEKITRADVNLDEDGEAWRLYNRALAASHQADG